MDLKSSDVVEKDHGQILCIWGHLNYRQSQQHGWSIPKTK